MYFTAEPMPVRPMTTSMTPAITVHMNRPSTPCTATMPATTTTNAPVGPPICVVEPPSSGDQKAGDDGAVNSGLRRQPGGDGERHGQRQGDQADGDAGDQVVQEFVQVVIAQAENRLRQPRVRQERC